MSKALTKGRQVLRYPIKAVKLHPEAELPFKENEADVGWDITVVARCDSRAEDTYQDVNTFSTGLVIKPPPGHHLEVIPNPSLWKTGYMFASSLIIINTDDEGELVIPLLKYKESEDLELPFRAAMLVLRPTEYAVVAAEAGAKGGRQTRPSQIEEEQIEFVAPPPTKKAGGRGKAKTNHMF